jgi:putative membrane protein
MFTLATPLLVHPGPWHDGGGGPGWWLVFPIAFGLFWIAVAVGAFVLLRRRTNPPAPPAPPTPRATAETLLAERFARGDIDEDEYYKRLATLQQSR